MFQAFTLFRRVFKASNALANVTRFMERHKALHRIYWHAATVIYLAHIAIQMQHLELETSIAGCCIFVELIAHLSEAA